MERSPLSETNAPLPQFLRVPIERLHLEPEVTSISRLGCLFWCEIRWNIKSRDSRTQMETVAPIPQEICHNFTFWALTYLLVTTYRQIWQDPKSGLHGDPHLHFLFLLFHLSAEGKASPTPPRLLNLLAEMQRTWIIVRRNLRGETKAGTGPGRAWWWNLPPTPPLPVIPDGDFNGGADEAELFRKYLFALYDN